MNNVKTYVKFVQNGLIIKVVGPDKQVIKTWKVTSHFKDDVIVWMKQNNLIPDQETFDKYPYIKSKW